MGNEQSKAKERTKSVKKAEKHENGSVHSPSMPDGPEIDGKTSVQNDGGPPSLDHLTDTTEYVVIESDSQPAPDVAPLISGIVDAATKTEEVLATVNEKKDDVLETVNKTKDDALETLNEKKDEVLETLNEKKEEVLETISKTEEVVENTIKAEAKKSKEKINLFGKMFKKKADPPAPQPPPVEVIEEKVAPSEDQTDQKALEESPPASDEPDTANAEPELSPEPEPESVTPDPSPEEEKAPEPETENSQPEEKQEESIPEENPVMNFFKTLVTPSKPQKRETATPAAAKDQVAQVSEPPAAPKGMSIPPPPPPEPPKMEIKAEPAAKPAKSSPKVEPKAAAKEPEPAKGKSAKDTLSKFFRPKKADPSKAGTLEAAAKPEPPPPVQEEKKTASKSAFLSLFKPKVLLDNMTSKVQAASTSGVRFLRRTAGVAADPKKETPAPAAAADAAQTAKEEPKAAAKSSEAAVENKPASAAPPAGEDAAPVPKLEKRNSIHKFFKNLGQKRGSTDAGVQTEAAAAAEKAK